MRPQRTYSSSFLFPLLLNRFYALGLLSLLSLGFPLAASAQTSGAGSTSTNFQKIGMGARAVGMGETFAGVADDSTAVFWNPAGLPLAKGTQFSLTHAEWLEGVTNEFFAFSQNIDQDGGFGGSLGYLGTGAFAGALENPDGTYGGVGENISASSFIGSLAYGQQLGNWIHGDFFSKSYLGVKATVVGQNVVNIGTTGLAFDIGYLYEVSKKTFYLGAVLSNLGTQIQNFSQPLMYTFAGSYHLRNLLIKKDRDIIAVATEGYVDTGLKFDLGDEYKLTFGRNAVALRLGYRTGGDLGAVAGITSGVGISHRFDDFDAGIDYAFVPYGILGMTHRVSLNLMFGGPLIIPEAYVNARPSFVLGDQTLDISFAAKSEEPIDNWKVAILDPSGMLVKTFSGKGNPPAHFLWDGKNQDGVLVPQANYSVHLEVSDENEMTGKARPKNVFAKWVPKKVPYQYTFGVSGDLLFDSAKDELLARGYAAVEKVARAIQKKYPTSMIIIAGHTDDQKLGKGAHFASNQDLSLARAQAVMNYLVKNGMAASNLSVVGYGDTKPIAPNKTPEGRSKNRRVELIVSGVQEATATDLIAEGQDLLKDKRYKDALERFLKALESDSRSAQAYHLAGDCYLTLGSKDQAIAAYRKAVEFNPADTDLKSWLRQYAPQPQMAPPAPVAPGPSNNSSQANPPQNQPANNPPAVAAAVPEAPAPAAPAHAPNAAPATGMPVPVEAN
ncbi:MAG TPA: PorV/PorQ family protein [bacterium]